MSESVSSAATMKKPAGSTILVGEDNHIVARVITKILEKEGHNILPVADGATALDALFNQRLVMALLDADLPGMNAMEVTNLYRFGSKGRGHVPILALMSDVDGAQLSAWIEAGLDGCIGKPIEPTELLDAVNGCLDHQDEPAVAAVAAEEPAAGPAVDVRVLRDLENLGGSKFVDDVIAQFAADASRLLPELSAAAAAADSALFRDHVHALRSCAGNVGAVGLYKLCLATQGMAARELVRDGGAYVGRLIREFNRAVSALDEHGWRAVA